MGTELFLKAGVSLDFESQTSLNVAVEVDDATIGTGPDDTANYSLAITDTNEAPSVQLLNTVNSIDETTLLNRLKVADIQVNDDALGSETLSLGGADAGLFEIIGTELFLKANTEFGFRNESDARRHD